MGDLLQQVYSVLTAFPGNIVYHLIVSFSILNALISTVSTQKLPGSSIRERTIVGLGALMGIRILIFFYSVVFGPLFDNSSAFLPILDWILTTFSVIVIIWLWLFSDGFTIADAIVPGVVVLTIVLGIFSGWWWRSIDAGLRFNQSPLDDLWNLYDFTLLAVGIVLMVMRTPVNYGSGLGMLLTLLIGHLLHLIAPNVNGSFPGGVRLFQMAAYPLLFTLSRRLDVRDEVTIEHDKEPFMIEVSEPYSIEPEDFRHIISLFDAFHSLDDGIQQLTRIVAEIMKADICYSVKRSADSQFIFWDGYDLHHQRDLEEIRLHEEQLPLLATSSRKSVSIRLQASSTSPDLDALGSALGLSSTGHLLGGFFSAMDNAGIILLTPHSQKRWDQENQQYFIEVTNSLYRVFRRIEDNYLHAEDRDMEILPDPDVGLEGGIRKEALLKLISFLRRQAA